MIAEYGRQMPPDEHQQILLNNDDVFTTLPALSAPLPNNTCALGSANKPGGILISLSMNTLASCPILCRSSQLSGTELDTQCVSFALNENTRLHDATSGFDSNSREN